MNLPVSDRLSNVTNLLIREEHRLSADSLERVRRLVQFTKYSLEYEPEVADTFIELAEQVIAKRN